MKFVIDSNLLISARNLNDCFNETASKLIEIINANDFEIIAPVLFLWEMDAYTRHIEKSKKHKSNTGLGFKVATYDVTSNLYTRTYCSQMACVKGADRVFVSLAMDHKVPLITNDKQIHKYSDVFGIKTIFAQDFVDGKF